MSVTDVPAPVKGGSGGRPSARRTKPSRPVPADVLKSRRRAKLNRWAELVEAVAEFQRKVFAAADDEVLDEIAVNNITNALKCLKCELLDAVPVEW